MSYKNSYNTKDLSLYYDGFNFKLGELSPERDGYIFVGLSGDWGMHLTKDKVNVDFSFHKPSVMVLKDAIEFNAYGNDRNWGLENAGLNEDENRFLESFYKLGKVNVGEALQAEDIINKIVTSRMERVDALKRASVLLSQHTSEDEIEK